ncbi:MAG TPA: hypothetical protein VNF07_02595 [Acidimicrobiales bacterium]|nr:hypothetical protein [Acidimicrobiales bacterium]
MLVDGPEGLAEGVRNRLGAVPVTTTVAALGARAAREDDGLFDLVFVVVGAAPSAGLDLEGVHGLAEVIAGVVVSGAGAAPGRDETVASLREVADLVLWSPDETLVDDLCEMLG